MRKENKIATDHKKFKWELHRRVFGYSLVVILAGWSIFPPFSFPPSSFLTTPEALIAPGCTTVSDSNSRHSSSTPKNDPGVILPPPNPYNFSVGICTVLKDAEARFEEWIHYHILVMKFQHIYIYDNSRSDLKQWYRQTREHPVYRHVTIHQAPGKTKPGAKTPLQMDLIQKCIQKYGKNQQGPQHDYMALIDGDEYLVPQNDKYTSIHSILNEYLVPFGGALVVNWMMVGTANRSTFAPIPITKRFQYRMIRPQSVVKSIVASKDFLKMPNPHVPAVVPGKQVYTTKAPGVIRSMSSRASDPQTPAHVLLCYHYRYKSMKEYMYDRCVKGNNIMALGTTWCKGDGTLKRDTPAHIQPAPGEVFDDKPWKLLTQYAPKYKIYDDWEDFL